MLFRLVPVSPERGKHPYFVDMSSKALVVLVKDVFKSGFPIPSLKASYPPVVPPMLRNQVDNTVLEFPEQQKKKKIIKLPSKAYALRQ